MELTPKISAKKREEQQRKYGNLIIANLTSNEIVKYLAVTEEEAELYEFQGQFYPYAYHEIAKILKSAMKKLSEQEVRHLFYYTLKLDYFFDFQERFYPLFLDAVEHLFYKFRDGGYYKCRVSELKMYLLLGMEKTTPISQLRQQPFDEYKLLKRFYKRVSSYTRYPNLRKKHERFDEFLVHPFLMDRLRNSVKFFTNFDFIAAGALVILLKDTDPSSKQVLLDFHTQNLERYTVWLLGSFYEDFCDTTANQALFEDLKERYPSEWIEEYV